MECARSLACASRAVRSYFARHARDCNADGVTDCIDVASIHVAGPDACNADWLFESRFWRSFSACVGFDGESRTTTD